MTLNVIGDKVVFQRRILFGKAFELALKFIAQYDFNFHTASSASSSLMKSSALCSLRQFKRLAKKYPSLKDDFITFKKELADDPFQGSDLGNGTRKVRMAIASKGKGKSGGARVITFNFIQHDDDSIEITLLTIYDKGEISSVTDKYIKWLVSLING